MTESLSTAEEFVRGQCKNLGPEEVSADSSHEAESND